MSTRESAAAVKQRFTEIFETNHWNSGESKSGTGSSASATGRLVPQLIDLIERRHLRSMVDAPCGDFNWISPVADRLSYRGFDIVDGVVAAAAARSHYEFGVADITADVLPTADVVHCRDCLVHLTFDLVWAALSLFKQSGSIWLLTTTFPDLTENGKGRLGGWRPLNLQAAPFSFGEPDELIVEKPDVALHPHYGRKAMGLWRIADLPAERGSAAECAG